MEPQQPPAADQPVSPGKSRTWWHPVLVRLLDVELHEGYEVRGEVSVGKMPLRLDVLLIRRQDGKLPEQARRDLHLIIERLNEFTLVEFKSPTDSLECGDLDYLFGCAHLFRSQQLPRVAHSELTLLVLASSINAAFREDVRDSGLQIREHQPGVHRIEGALFATWVIETDRLSNSEEPILSLFSRVFLRQWQVIIKQMRNRGLEHVLYYFLQQVEQFRHVGGAFVMQKEAEFMSQVTEELRAAVLRDIPAEARLQGLSPETRLQGLSPETRLQGLSPETRLHGLSPEERLQGLSPETRLQGLSPETRLHGLSPEERLKGLSLEERLQGLSLEEILRAARVRAEQILAGLSEEERQHLRELLEREQRNP